VAVDLIFSEGLAVTQPPVDLTFGADTALKVVSFSAALPSPGGAFAVAVESSPVTFSAFLAAPDGAVVVRYDVNIPNYLEARASAVWRDAAAVQPTTARVPWASASAVRAGTNAVWRDSPTGRVATAALWRDGSRVAGSASAPWRDTERVRPAPTSLAWRDSTGVRPPSVRFPWRDGVGVARRYSAPWQDGKAVRVDQGMPWREGARHQQAHLLAWREGRTVALPHALPWRDGDRVSTHGGTPFPPVVAPPYDPCYTPPRGDAVKLVFADLYDGGTGLLFVCTNHPPPTASVVVPVRKVYVVINNTHLIKLDGMVELDTLAMHLTLDAQSWTWSFDASLRANQLPLVRRAPGAPPVMLAAVINGVSYYMVAEGISRDRRFNEAAIRITGRGKSALLESPYAATQSFGNVAARTAAQLLDDALSTNGVGIGWTVESALTDWLVPAGVWSHVGSHMSAALSVAGAAGGYIQPHPTADTLRVLARYPSAPWDWGSVTPDFSLPASVARLEGINWVEKARYNRVFVSGVGQGVLCQVTRAGTAGDLVAPMVTDPLITQAAAGRQRGINELADTGLVATVSLGLPVLPETGVITPGKFVNYVDGSTTRIGIVRSTSVEVAMPEVWQTIEVETHE
jgi:hypothetical protein